MITGSLPGAVATTNACSPQPSVLTHTLAWAAYLKRHSNATRMAVTLSKDHLPSYVRRLDDLTEYSQLPDWPGVGSEKLRTPAEPGDTEDVIRAAVTPTRLVVSH